MRDFKTFGKLIHDRFQEMASGDLYVVDVHPDELWDIYLKAFPEGSNLIFRERTEHDCSCCKQFIRRAGNVVDANHRSVWGVEGADHPYDGVAAILSGVVETSDIVDIFRVSEGAFGAEITKGMSPDGNVERWHHFYTGPIPKRFRSTTPEQVRGDYRTTVGVLQRGLDELTPEALATVLSLIDANNLYRGAEHRGALVAFMKLQQEYQAAEDKGLFVWTRGTSKAARFRNTVIGTLATDLSDGVPIEEAVGKFESKVAPQNYKRTKALITPGMVKEAMKTIGDLDLEPALERRFARIDDINVNDVLWVDNNVKPLMKGGIGDALMDHVEEHRSHDDEEDRAEDIPVDQLLNGMLGDITSMEVLLKGEHLDNLMSLTAPVYPDPQQLFRWGNDFAWSYAGNIADSIKERVRKAGGKVTGVQLRASLSWFNLDDLDIHVRGPGGHISFNNKRGRCGGRLDIDMNVSADTREAVENIVWSQVPDGVYQVSVRNYTHRETVDVGFVIEIENQGRISHFNFPHEVMNRQEIPVVSLQVKDGVVYDTEALDPRITSNAVGQEKWGLKTENFVKVNTVTLSPNFWGDNAVGNQHTFFVLDGALNDEPTRGIYNEFLHPRLEQHRKVFEVIGDKTKCQPTEGQLSGLGFSSTKRDSVVIRVNNQRLYRVRFGA